MRPMARHLAREYAVQALYQWQISETPSPEIEQQFRDNKINQETDIVYFKELIYTIPIISRELDEHILPFASRPIQEIDPVELAILRLGTYELAKRIDIPYRVIINEALELTKKFGSIEGFKFVNGVLDQVARVLRVHEIVEKKSTK